MGLLSNTVMWSQLSPDERRTAIKTLREYTEVEKRITREQWAAYLINIRCAPGGIMVEMYHNFPENIS